MVGVLWRTPWAPQLTSQVTQNLHPALLRARGGGLQVPPHQLLVLLRAQATRCPLTALSLLVHLPKAFFDR